MIYQAHGQQGEWGTLPSRLGEPGCHVTAAEGVPKGLWALGWYKGFTLTLSVTGGPCPVRSTGEARSQGWWLPALSLLTLSTHFSAFTGPVASSWLSHRGATY